MALTIGNTKELPAVTRSGGRSSEETKQLAEAVSDLSSKVIKDVPIKGEGNFSSLSQKVRYAAGTVGLGVSVHQVLTDDDDTVELHFEGFVPEPEQSTKKASTKK